MQQAQIEAMLRRMGIEPTGFTGKWVQAPCPFAAHRHPRGSDRNPSFGVMVGTPSVYNCFTCHSKGRFADLPKEAEATLSVDSGAAMDELLNDMMVAEATGAVVETGMIPDYEPIPSLPEEVFGDLFPPVSEVREAMAYCNDRDVDAETCEYLGLGAWPEERRIMFPVRNFDGLLYGYVGRSWTKDRRAKVWNTKGLDKSSLLMGAELCDPKLPFVLVEGPFAYAGFHALGVPGEMGVNVVAIMGSELGEGQAHMLAEIGQPVTFFLDGDKAGREGVWGTDKKEGSIHMLSRLIPCKSVDYPQGIIDPDDLNLDEACDMIENARSYTRVRRRGR